MAPPNTVWMKQISHAISWLRAFFINAEPGITRHFCLQEYRQAHPTMEVGTDASPWGLGGWYSDHGVITHFYFCAITQHDLDILEIERGSCEAQQVLEGLAILVALRVWYANKCQTKVALKVRGDNVGALNLLVNMRPKSARQAIIARELALSLTNFSFPPSVSHTPGLSHVIADGLSRLHDPAKENNMVLSHPALTNAVRTFTHERPRSWYRALEEKSTAAHCG